MCSVMVLRRGVGSSFAGPLPASVRASLIETCVSPSRGHGPSRRSDAVTPLVRCCPSWGLLVAAAADCISRIRRACTIRQDCSESCICISRQDPSEGCVRSHESSSNGRVSTHRCAHITLGHVTVDTPDAVLDEDVATPGLLTAHRKRPLLLIRRTAGCCPTGSKRLAATLADVQICAGRVETASGSTYTAGSPISPGASPDSGVDAQL